MNLKKDLFFIIPTFKVEKLTNLFLDDCNFSCLCIKNCTLNKKRNCLGTYMLGGERYFDTH